MNNRHLAILFLGGVNLVFLQFFVIREINAILLGTEIVLLLTVVAYFSGYSIGYCLAGRLSNRVVRRVAWLTWGLHLTLPFSIRYFLGFAYQRVESLTFFITLFFAAFALSSFYSLLLPLFIDEDTPRLLTPYYGAELVGAVCGLVIILLFGQIPWLIPVFYQACLAGVIFLLMKRPVIAALGGLVVVAYILAFPSFQTTSMNYVYRTIHSFDGAQVVYSVNSPYQKVDIVRGKRGLYSLYLDGLRMYDPDELSWFNIFLSELPALLQRPADVLIVGSGSMQSVARVSPFAQRVTTVELDHAVVTGSRIYFADVNHLSQIDNWQLVIDDAKHFLGRTDDRYDMVIMDVPAPFTIQVGLLHTVEFYKLIKSRLKPGGIISVNLSGRLQGRSVVPRSVAAALLSAFDEIYVIRQEKSVGVGFALAGDDIRFSRKELARALRLLGEDRFEILGKREVVDLLDDVKPISLSNLRDIVRRSWFRVVRRYLSS